MGKTAEFRGCDNLVIARVTKDDATGYTTGTVVSLAEVARIAKSTEQSSEMHYYDNVGKVPIKAIGSDTITMIVPALTLRTLALITGASIDPSTGAYSSGEGDTDYEYALGYRLKLTDGTYRYVWRLKGTFSAVPDEESETESNSINTHNQTVTFTGTLTTFPFNNGGRKRDFVIDERDGMANVSRFFEQVHTPDNSAYMAINAVTALSISPETKTMEAGETFRFTLNITPAGTLPFWASSNPNVATIDAAGDITAVSPGTTIITASAGNLSASATLTVTEAE